MPREKISIPGYARFVDALLDALGVERGGRRRQLDGRVHRRRARDRSSRHRVERLVLVSRRGPRRSSTSATSASLGALRTRERLSAACGGCVGARSDAVARRPRLRGGCCMRLVVRHPDLLPAPLIAEQVRGAGKPGFLDALDALTDYPIRDRLRRDRAARR